MIRTNYEGEEHIILESWVRGDSPLVPGERILRDTFKVQKSHLSAMWKASDNEVGIYGPPLSSESVAVLQYLLDKDPALYHRLNVKYPRDSVDNVQKRVNECFKAHGFHRKKLAVEAPGDGAGAQPMAALILPVVQQAQQINQAQPNVQAQSVDANPVQGLVKPEPGLANPEPGLANPEPGLVKPEPGLVKPEPGLVKAEPVDEESQILKERRRVKAEAQAKAQANAAKLLQLNYRHHKSKQLVMQAKRDFRSRLLKATADKLVKVAAKVIAEDETMRDTLYGETLPALLAALPQLPAAQGPAKRQKTDEVIILDD
jgi:hypothetical protein